MPNFNELTEKIIKFRNERDWEKFHNPKNVAISLALEAAEVLEHFQWYEGEELDKYVKENREAIGEELSDTLYWVLLLSHDLEIDLEKTFEKKMAKNAKKYPVKKAKGNATKYTKL